ncbi:MAG: sulfatase-like hydrolase/transferase, partial [bacterium]
MRSLILLTIDAWRADFADAFAGVPLLPSLAGRPHARLTRLSANGPWTSPALVSLFTGEPVLQHGVHHAWDAPRRDSVGLAQVFRDHGAHVPDLCYLNRVLNYHHLGYPEDTAPPSPTGPDDPVIFDAITDAAARKSPSFLWYHYKYVHLPYWPAVEFRRLFGVEDVPARLRDSVGTGFIVPREDFTLDPADRDLVQRLYAAGVRQMDAWLARVLAHLDHSGLDATVVITADH